MRSRSLQALVQMSVVLGLVAVALALITVWRWHEVHDVLLADWKSLALNGVVVLIFVVGTGQLFRAFGHYAREERILLGFQRERSHGRPVAEILEQPASRRSLLSSRYQTIRELFERGVPIDHGTISALSQADESSRQSFPRFVNNVLILTGVFGTVSSLIFALIGAGDVLRESVPNEGLGLMLLGMNTALTTTATAIVCYFLFSYFFQKLNDVQTSVLSGVERAVMVEIIPEFQFDSQTNEHQTKLLLNELAQLVMDIRRGVNSAVQTLGDLDRDRRGEDGRWDEMLQAQAEQTRRLDGMLAALGDLDHRLVDGFRLPRDVRREE